MPPPRTERRKGQKEGKKEARNEEPEQRMTPIWRFYRRAATRNRWTSRPVIAGPSSAALGAAICVEQELVHSTSQENDREKAGRGWESGTWDAEKRALLFPTRSHESTKKGTCMPRRGWMEPEGHEEDEEEEEMSPASRSRASVDATTAAHAVVALANYRNHQCGKDESMEDLERKAKSRMPGHTIHWRHGILRAGGSSRVQFIRPVSLLRWRFIFCRPWFGGGRVAAANRWLMDLFTLESDHENLTRRQERHYENTTSNPLPPAVIGQTRAAVAIRIAQRKPPPKVLLKPPRVACPMPVVRTSLVTVRFLVAVQQIKYPKTRPSRESPPTGDHHDSTKITCNCLGRKAVSAAGYPGFLNRRRFQIWGNDPKALVSYSAQSIGAYRTGDRSTGRFERPRQEHPLRIPDNRQEMKLRHGTLEHNIAGTENINAERRAQPWRVGQERLRTRVSVRMGHSGKTHYTSGVTVIAEHSIQTN
ncbi:hypothetical protein EDB87DRAFT_1577641 [Lactarius vividus]|nr:hypothetical protein EDB87DRAFT_1577641 [Lactarius vividus]